MFGGSNCRERLCAESDGEKPKDPETQRPGDPSPEYRRLTKWQTHLENRTGEGGDEKAAQQQKDGKERDVGFGRTANVSMWLSRWKTLGN